MLFIAVTVLIVLAVIAMSCSVSCLFLSANAGRVFILDIFFFFLVCDHMECVQIFGTSRT